MLPGILYASEAIETASAFSVLVTTPRCLDLTTAPWSDPPGRWTHPHDYAPTQKLATQARAADIATIRAPSARLAGGINLAVLDPAALVPPPRPHSS